MWNELFDWSQGFQKYVLKVLWVSNGGGQGVGKSFEPLWFRKSSNILIHFRCWIFMNYEELHV